MACGSFRQHRSPHLRIKTAALLIFLFLTACRSPQAVSSSPELEPVTLQLRWYHQFQTAGYYAALEQGYYRDAGLDVTILPGGPFNTYEEVLSGRAQYGVTNTEVLLHRLDGDPLVALATIFQHSPQVFMVRQDSDIYEPKDLAGRRVGMSTSTRTAELQAMLLHEGVSLTSLDLVDRTSAYSEYLFDETIDAQAVYATNEPFVLENAGIPTRLIAPAAYGVDFYGDLLYTTEAELEEHPDRVARFRAASLKGWQYALDHPEETIDIILANYDTSHGRDQLTYEAAMMREYILPDVIEIGHMNPDRWQHIADIYVALGMADPGYTLDGFLYDSTPIFDHGWLYLLIAVAGGIALLVALAAVGLAVFNRRLHTAVTQRTAQLQTSEQRYRGLFDNSLEAIFIADDQGYYLDANPAACEMLGYTRAELLTMGVWDISANPDRDLFQQAWNSFKAAGFSKGNYTLRSKDGKLIESEFQSVANFMPGLHLSALRDVTQRKLAEEERREIENRFRALFELSPDAFLLAEVATGMLVDANPAAEMLLQLPRDQIIGRHHESLYPPDQQPKAHESFRYRPPTTIQEPPPMEIDLVSAAGHRKTVEIRGRNIELAGREYVFGAFRDISERKQWEKKLQESEALHRLLFENAPVGIGYYTLDGRVISFNHLAAEMMNGRPQDFVGKSLIELHGEVAGQTFQDRISAAAVSENTLTFMDFVQMPTGENWFDSSYNRIMNPLGQVIGVQIIAHDVTATKKAEAALRESEELYRITIENISDPIFITDDDGRFTFICPNVMHSLGYTDDEVWALGHINQLFDPPLNTPEFLASGEVHHLDRTISDKHGHPHDFLISAKRVAIKDGTILFTCHDITELKKAAATLREAEASLRGLVNATSDVVVLLDADGIIIEGNEKLAQNFGCSRDALIGKNIYEFMGGPVGEARGAYMAQVLATGESVRFVDERNGRVFHNIIHPVLDDTGQAVRIAVYARDITEERQAQAHIREIEAKNQAILEALPDMMFMLNQQGEIVDYRISDAGDLILDPEQVVGSNIQDAMPPEIVALILDNVARCFETGQIQHFEYRLQVQRGPQDFEARMTKSSEAYVLTIVRNITGRKTAEVERETLLKQIQTQAHLMQKIMDSVPEGLLLVDPNGVVLLKNPTAEAYLSVLADTQSSDTISHLGAHPLSAFYIPPTSGQFHEVQKDDLTFEIVAQPFTASATLEGWLLLIRDVTLEREWQTRSQQQERLAAVGQLAAGMAHDFNNILAVISLYAELLQLHPALPLDLLARVQIIGDQTHKASDLIQQILDFSRRSLINLQPIDFQTLLQETIHLLARTLPETIDVSLVAGDFFPVIEADATRIQQALLNLAVNSRDAMPHGGALRLELTPVHIAKEHPAAPLDLAPGEWVRLDVMDTGAGIPADILPHIFEPFFTTKAPKGNGLGLAQVYGIIKQHNGDLTVTSTPGAGTQFSIYLPIVTGGDSVDEASEAAAIPQGRGQTILVVEDQDLVRSALADSLVSLHYEVITAVHGHEALAIYDASPEGVDLVITDMIMPVMGGKELYYALRKRETAVPVIIISGYVTEEERRDLGKHDQVFWMPKPPNLQQLAALLAQLLPIA